MKNYILSFALLLLAGNVWGQVESPIYKTVAEKFEKEYNLNQYDSIFSMFSVEMKNALPLNKTIEFFTELYGQARKITQREFIKYEMQTTLPIKQDSKEHCSH